MKSSEAIDQETWDLIRRISKNIKANRKKLGLTQNEMEKLGFGPRWYQRLESGRHIPTIPTLYRLAKAFQIEITDFFK